MKRIGFHYLFAIIVLAIYGGRVCPFIATLSLGEWGLVLAVAFGAAFGARRALLAGWVDLAAQGDRPRREFQLDLWLYLVAGAAVMAYNAGAHDFPLGSGMKIVTATLALGFFAGVDTALHRQLALHAGGSAITGESGDRGRYFPLTAQFTAVTLVTLAAMSALFFLLVARDLEWIDSMGAGRISEGRWAVLKEVVFVGTVILLEVMNLAVSFARNLKRFFYVQNSVLTAVAGGDFLASVPVATHDEFGEMGRRTNAMIGLLRDRDEQLAGTRREILARLGRAGEFRDNETGLHVVRMSRFCDALARAIGLAPAECEEILQASPMHDIGKIGIPDRILLKPGRLDDDERVIMNTHAEMGAVILSGGDSALVRLAETIARTHHEKWDGTGYPNGLKGEEIPLAGRIVALCDVFDALTSNRPYKTAWPLEKTLEFLREQKGKHFDPELVEKFMQILPEILGIRERYLEAPAHAA